MREGTGYLKDEELLCSAPAVRQEWSLARWKSRPGACVHGHRQSLAADTPSHSGVSRGMNEREKPLNALLASAVMQE